MKIKNINFEEYLKMSHASEYAGVDDDMPDDFERWVGEEHEHDAFESEIQYYIDALLTSAKKDIYDYIEKEFGYRIDEQTKGGKE